jgi:photosystem II stability/assembly factor-like uncharacterized protein
MVQSCLFVNDLIGFAIIDMIGECHTAIFRTDDGGKSWTDSCLFDGYDLFFMNENSGWTVGRYMDGDKYGAGIMATSDGGKNWELTWTFPDQNNNQPALQSIQFIYSTTGWAVGDFGLLVKYTDSLQWHVLPKITTLPLNKVFFVDKNNGFIAGGYLNWDGEFQAVLFQTINGGESWQEIPDLPYLIHDIYFTDSFHGWAVGTDKSGAGVILMTTDGGEHWTAQVDSLIGLLHALSYRDGFLWAVGDYGLVLRLDVATAIETDKNAIPPAAFQIFQNYPNPFNAKTVIHYSLPAAGDIDLSIYNILGQRVKTLVSAKQPAGSYKVEWEAENIASGVYLCRLQAGGFVQTKKLLVIK